LYTNSVVEKTNGTAFNPTTTLKLIYISPIDCAFQKNVKYYISLSTQYILLITIVKYNMVSYQNNVIIILNE